MIITAQTWLLLNSTQAASTANWVPCLLASSSHIELVCSSLYVINVEHILYNSDHSTPKRQWAQTPAWLTRCPGTSLSPSQSQARNSSIHHYKWLAPLRCQFDKNSAWPWLLYRCQRDSLKMSAHAQSAPLPKTHIFISQQHIVKYQSI